MNTFKLPKFGNSCARAHASARAQSARLMVWRHRGMATTWSLGGARRPRGIGPRCADGRLCAVSRRRSGKFAAPAARRAQRPRIRSSSDKDQAGPPSPGLGQGGSLAAGPAGQRPTRARRRAQPMCARVTSLALGIQSLARLGPRRDDGLGHSPRGRQASSPNPRRQRGSTGSRRAMRGPACVGQCSLPDPERRVQEPINV